jgi:acylaminoacyl-peptidase
MKIPTLQLLGGKDRRVPFRQGLLFDAITKKHGTKIETYLYEEEGHRLGDQLETSVDCVMKVVQFLEEMKVSKNTEEKTK